MEEIRKKLLDIGFRLELVNAMTNEELVKTEEYDNVYDLENYLLAIAIKNNI